LSGEVNGGLKVEGGNGWADLVTVLWSPGRAFARVRNRASFWPPLIVLLAANLAFTLVASARTRELMEEMNFQDAEIPVEAMAFIDTLSRVIVPLSAVVGVVASILVVALVLLVLQQFIGGRARFGTLFTVVAMARIPSIFKGIIHTWLVSFVPASEIPYVTVSAAAFLPRESFGSLTYQLLSHLDPFAFWYLALLGIGFAVVNGVSLRRGVVPVVLMWLVYALGISFLSALALGVGGPGAF